MNVVELMQKMISGCAGSGRRKRKSGPARNRPLIGQFTNYEHCEPRAMMAAVAPSSYDQYMVELVNRARANPAAYAQSLGIALNEGLPAGTISSDAKQPLAINPYITDAAQKHSQWMINTDTFSHTGAGGSTSRQRMESAGYVFHSGAIWAENLGIELRQTSVDVEALTKLIQEKLFRDNGVSGRGHRLNILDPRFAEIGIGVRSGVYTYQGTNFNAVVATQKFAKSGNAVFLTGVAFDDRIIVNQFYTPGEGLGNVLIRAVRDGTGETFTTKTWASGGYSLALPPGKYSIMASGGGLGNSQFLPAVVIGANNRKFDFRKGVIRTAPEIAITGNQLHLKHGQTETSQANYTDFGTIAVAQGSLTRPFVVRNLGNAPLVLSGPNRVQVVGVNRSDFSVVALTAESIAGGGLSAFTIRFDPSAAGLRTAIVRVWSNDGDERPFRFTISGQGVANRGAESTAESPISRAQLVTAAWKIDGPVEQRSFVAVGSFARLEFVWPALLAPDVGLTTAQDTAIGVESEASESSVAEWSNRLSLPGKGDAANDESSLIPDAVFRPVRLENQPLTSFSRRLPVA